MKKLLTWLDDNILKIGVSFTILFTALYPKLPSIHIVRTWVYIRLEDFLIALIVFIWLTQLVRRKVKLPLPVGIPLVVYWVSGLLTFFYSLIFVAPHIINFFPHIAALEYLRRIEYMILFFVAFSTIRSVKDVKHYFYILCITLVGIVLYGFGQRYYLDIWSYFPDFFTKHPFCFPSFQTGNEEFAKGIPLCLPKEARITSTFGGHYDLAGYLVVVLPILFSVFATVKKVWTKIFLGALFILSLMLLIFTASRVSFFAYLLGTIFALIFLKRKRWIFPLVAISIVVLLVFNGATAKRLFETFRVVNVVTNSSGQVVGVAENNLPDALKNKIAKDQSVVVEAPPPTENLPSGSSYITLPQAPVATSVAVVKNQLSPREALRLKLANGGLEIATISGTFLIKRALVYDISFTTRFQAEWPSAWAAFLSDPPLGKGYSTITLASDNDYLRLLGESGFLGFISFISIFFILGIFLRQSSPHTDPFAKVFALGLAGGVIGLFANATLIDIFEASKVAEPLWLLLGIATGGVALSGVKVVYWEKIKRILTSHIFLVTYLIIILLIVFGAGLANFFVGDDFTWLKWAATTAPADLVNNFVNAGGFFYRPFDKTLVFFLYNFLAFAPQGYHGIVLLLHFLMAFGMYLLGLRIFKKKLWAWIGSVIFLILPIHAETVFWFATISTSLSSVFMFYAVLAFIGARDKSSKTFYIISILGAVFALLSYEMAAVFPLLIIATDLLLLRNKITKKSLLLYVPFILLDALYFYVRAHVNVAPVGGDYAYNISKLLPNVFGNLLGYAGLMFSGTQTFGWYDSLRNNFRPYALIVGILFGLFTLCLIAVGIWKKVWKNISESGWILLYGLLFSFVALLPFLGLGNITERYGYLAGVGVTLVMTIILMQIAQLIRNKKVRFITLSVLLLGFSTWSICNLWAQEKEWASASFITEETLGTFRFQYESIQDGSHIYFVNVPIKYKNAWVFPVGLPDGLWFIYRDTSMKIYQLDSLSKAKTLSEGNVPLLPAKNYIFVFNKNNELDEIK